MKFCSFQKVAAAGVLFSNIAAEAKAACWPFDHPKYTCGTPIPCPIDWPHGTGNYGNSSYAQTETCTALGSDLPSAYNQCCMPTVECYEHAKTAPREKNGKFVELEDFYKFACCLEEFLRPKAWCMHPPGFDLDEVTWNLPPACSIWEGNSQHNAYVFMSDIKD